VRWLFTAAIEARLAAELGDAVHVDWVRLVLLGVEVALQTVEDPACADIDEGGIVLSRQIGRGLRHDRVFDPRLFRMLFADLDICQRRQVQHQVRLELVEGLGHRAFVLAIEVFQPIPLVRLDLPVCRQHVGETLAEIRIDRIYRFIFCTGLFEEFHEQSMCKFMQAYI